MSFLTKSIVCLLFIGITNCKFSFEPSPYANVLFINENESRESILKKAAYVVPTHRQLEWQLRERAAFLHFGINTFTDKEWGDGTEDPKLFNPKNLDANQWVSVLKESGFNLIIITAKHHDGFCLWPSAFTDHSVKNSLWKNGTGDVIKDLADACVKQKMDLGIYLSPWDRHEKSYGTEAYNLYFKNQLRELLTNYGDIAEVWFDGAIGEGSNGKKQNYDWIGYYELIRTLQPNATIAVKGPDVRWVGTESGYGRDVEWSAVPVYDTTGWYAQDMKDNILIPDIDATQEEVATINQLIKAKAIKWYPSEVDVSIRPGWFYHANEDTEVKSPEKLLDIYFNSIGKNSALLLNIPPDQNGLIAEKDATILKVFQNSLRIIFDRNLAKEATLTGSEFNLQHRVSSVIDHKYKSYWSPDNNFAPHITFEWDKPVWFNIISISEQIEFGQRVNSFQLEIFENDAWITKLSGTTIGYKKLMKFPYIVTKKARLIFSENRDKPYISEIGFFQDIPTVTIEPRSQPFSDSIQITLSTNNPDATIHYSQNFTTPSSTTNLYSEPIKLKSSSPILAIAINNSGLEGFVADENYSKALYGVSLLTTPDPEYLHEGGITLCDGIKGDDNFKTKKWLGFKDENLELLIDLKEKKEIRAINIIGMVHKEQNIVAPEIIKLFSSQTGEINSYKLLHQFSPTIDSGKKVQTFSSQNLKHTCQYLKILVENPGKTVGDSLIGNWIFVSEVEVR